MVKSPYLESLILQLDQAVLAGAVVLYVLDGNLLGLAVRYVAQLQFKAPKTHHPSRALGFHMAACGLLNGLTLLFHLVVPLQSNPRGIIIDFVGQTYIPNKLYLSIVDIALGLLQALCLLLAYECAHYGEEADLNDGVEMTEADCNTGSNGNAIHDAEAQAANLSSDHINGSTDTYPADLPEEKYNAYKEHLVIDLRWRQTLYRITSNKPISTASDAAEEDASANNTGTNSLAATRMRRIRARIQRRRREMGRSPDAGTVQAEQRLDHESDEEREIGRDVHVRV